MNRLLLFLILCIASTHLGFSQYNNTYSLGWGGGKYFQVKSYGGEYSQPDYMILLLGSNRMKEAEWRITATVKNVRSVYNNVVKDSDFPVNMLNLMLTSKDGSSNIPVGNINNMMVWNNLQGLNNEVELVTFQSLKQDGYHQLYLNFELHVMGGEYLKKFPIWSIIQFTFEYKLYSRSQSNQPWEHEMTFVNNDSHFQLNIDPNSQVPVYSITVTPDVLLEYNSITDYMNGVEKTCEKGLKVSASGNYEVRAKSQTSQFTSTTSSRTLPLDLVSLQLSGGNGTQQPVNISTTNQLILQGATTNGNVVEYDMIYKAKPIEDLNLKINNQETFTTQLMFELTTN